MITAAPTLANAYKNARQLASYILNDSRQARHIIAQAIAAAEKKAEEFDGMGWDTQAENARELAAKLNASRAAMEKIADPKCNLAVQTFTLFNHASKLSSRLQQVSGVAGIPRLQAELIKRSAPGKADSFLDALEEIKRPLALENVREALVQFWREYGNFLQSETQGNGFWIRNTSDVGEIVRVGEMLVNSMNSLTKNPETSTKFLEEIFAGGKKGRPVFEIPQILRDMLKMAINRQFPCKDQYEKMYAAFLPAGKAIGELKSCREYEHKTGQMFLGP